MIIKCTFAGDNKYMCGAFQFPVQNIINSFYNHYMWLNVI